MRAKFRRVPLLMLRLLAKLYLWCGSFKGKEEGVFHLSLVVLCAGNPIHDDSPFVPVRAETKIVGRCRTIGLTPSFWWEAIGRWS
jgi:hypothetical protein